MRKVLHAHDIAGLEQAMVFAAVCAGMFCKQTWYKCTTMCKARLVTV